jgi:hypothetical protein
LHAPGLVSRPAGPKCGVAVVHVDHGVRIFRLFSHA